MNLLPVICILQSMIMVIQYFTITKYEDNQREIEKAIDEVLKKGKQ